MFHWIQWEDVLHVRHCPESNLRRITRLFVTLTALPLTFTSLRRTVWLWDKILQCLDIIYYVYKLLERARWQGVIRYTQVLVVWSTLKMTIFNAIWSYSYDSSHVTLPLSNKEIFKFLFAKTKINLFISNIIYIFMW